MAIKPTIHKFNVSLSDLDRDYYESLNLTVAQHPSETVERMMARLLAYCINSQERLSFTKGLSETEEPDLWVKTLDDQIELWIDIGEPGLERLKKANSRAAAVKVYSFNTKSTVWWNQLHLRRSGLPVAVFRFDWEAIVVLASLVERTMTMSVTITNDSAYVATQRGECEVGWIALNGA